MNKTSSDCIIFHKFHGLGNDYIVIDPNENNIELNKELIQKICDRNYGVGSDGILLGPIKEGSNISLRILNPDGSEAEKSGNGLRIFSRYLYEMNLVHIGEEFEINTLGGMVKSTVLNSGKLIKIEMGKVSFDSQDIPVKNIVGEVINKEIIINGEKHTYCAATVGNPHCVILVDSPTQNLAEFLGPFVENDNRFPNRTNVQFMKVVDKNTIQIEIWERGAGYTLASGSSSTAAASIAYKLGHCEKNIVVRMPGGNLEIEFDEDYNATMVGPVEPVCDGKIRKELYQDIIQIK